jgi:PAS domain S-box-containing protein
MNLPSKNLQSASGAFFPRVIGYLTAGTGIIVLAGWLGSWPSVRDLLPGFTPMKANTALTFTLAGMALVIKTSPRCAASRAFTALANFGCGAMVSLAALVLIEHLLNLDLGIDPWLIHQPAPTGYSLRMAFPTAASFVLLGLGLGLSHPTQLRPAPVWLVAIPAAISGLTLVGYLFDVGALIRLGPFAASTAHTAFGLVLLSAGIWSAGRAHPFAAWGQKTANVGLGVALLVLAVIGIGLARNTRELIHNAQLVAHTFTVINQLTETLAMLVDAETGARGYLLTGQDALLEPYREASAKIALQIRQLRVLTADNLGQQRRLDALEPLINLTLARARTNISLMAAGNPAAATASEASGAGKRLMDGIRASIAAMGAEEEHLLKERLAHTEADSLKTMTTFGLGMLVSLSLLVAVFIWLRWETGQHRRAATELGRSEKNLAVTLNSIGDAVLATDAQGRVTRLNPVAEKMTGWPQAEALGRPVGEVFKILNEQTREPAEVPVERVLATGEIHGLANHTVLITRDGAEHPISDSAAPIRDPDGGLSGVVLVFHDVTLERQAQRQLAARHAEIQDLYNAAPCGYHSLNAEGIVSAINDTELAWLGYRREEILGKKKFTELLTASSRSVFAFNFPNFKKRGWIKDLEFELVRKDGSCFIVLLSATAILDAQGHYVSSRSTLVDITERKRAEMEKEQLFQISPDLLCVSSADGFFKQVSPAITPLLGWSAEEFLSQPYLDWVHPDDQSATLREVERQVVQGEKVLNFENRYRHKNGSWRYLAWRSVPQPGGLMYGTARDVTDIRAMQEALRRSEESLSVTLNSIGDAVLATDIRGCVTRMNPIAEQLSGWSQADALGKPATEVFRIIHEETRQPAVVPVDKVLQTGEIHGLANHTLLIARDGTERPIADSAAPIRGKDGKLIGVVLVFRDVTEERRTELALRESQRRLQQLNEDLEQRVEERTTALTESVRLGLAALNALTAHVTILDEQGVIVATNRSWDDYIKNIGLLPMASGIGVSYTGECQRLTGQAPESAAQLVHGIREVLAGRKTAYDQEYSSLGGGGGKRWYFCRVTRFPGDDGPARVVVASENITQIKLLQNQQFRNQRMESLGTLAGGVAHDLNNALSPILLGSQILREQYPDQTELVDMLQASAQRGADMVRQLLAFARGAEGERKPVNLYYVFKEIRSLITGSFPKNIRLEIQCDKTLPSVLGDPTQIHQILLNLCVNARDAMPDGGTLTMQVETIQVDAAFAAATPDAQPGPYALMRVRDTGTGIPPEILDHIFEPFFTTKSPDKGTGLGLATVLGIVKGHGGFLKVESQLKQGTVFSVYLPADPGEQGERAARDLPPEFYGHGETILFIDDEASLRRVGRAVLSHMNFNVLVAADGSDGLVQLAENRSKIRAIITDLHMPRMDGVAFVRMARRMLPDVAIIVASGRMEAKEAQELEPLNITVCLNKPFSETELSEALKRIFTPAGKAGVQADA